MARGTTRATRRSRDKDEDYIEDVARRGPADGDDPDYDEDAERYSSRRTRQQDDADERRSVSRRRSRDADEDDRPARRSTTRSRPRDEDSDEDGAERRRSSRSEGARGATSTSIGRGRDGLRKHRDSRKSGFASSDDKFKIDDGEEVLVKFVDDDFFITYYEHQFFDDFKNEKRQKTFVCLGDDCPLCDIGDDPKFFALINVIDLRNPRKPVLKLWYATPDPAGKIEAKMDSLEEQGRKKFGDDEDRYPRINDPDRYYVVTKTKKAGNSKVREYSLEAKKARDLDEEGYGEPLSDQELVDFAQDAFTDDIVRINKRSDLFDIADELSGE